MKSYRCFLSDRLSKIYSAYFNILFAYCVAFDARTLNFHRIFKAPFMKFCQRSLQLTIETNFVNLSTHFVNISCLTICVRYSKTILAYLASTSTYGMGKTNVSEQQSCRNYRQRWNVKIFCTDLSANFYLISSNLRCAALLRAQRR